MLGPALAVFGALFLVRLAPWEWDNTKVLLWCYVAALPPIGSLVLARVAAAWRAALVFGLLFSGAVSVLGASLGRGPRLEVLNRAEHEGVCRALAGVKASRVATAPTFNHPVALCGQPIVAGYAGHLWSHGLDAAAVQQGLVAADAGGGGLARGGASPAGEPRVLGRPRAGGVPRLDAAVARRARRPWPPAPGGRSTRWTERPGGGRQLAKILRSSSGSAVVPSATISLMRALGPPRSPPRIAPIAASLWPPPSKP